MEFFDASRFLSRLEVTKDVVVKRATGLPLVRRGNDVDIYTVRTQGLLEDFEREVLADKSLEARVYEVDKHHFQFDIFDSDGFAIKLDVYSGAPQYQRFAVKDYFFYRMVLSGQVATVERCSFPVLGKVEEGLVRYFEYIEHFWSGPEKPQHLEWILSELTKEEQAELFELAHQVVSPRGSETPTVSPKLPTTRLALGRKAVQLLKEVYSKFFRLSALRRLVTKACLFPGGKLHSPRARL